MKDYLIIVAGGNGDITVKANSPEEAVNTLPESERPWVLQVMEM